MKIFMIAAFTVAILLFQSHVFGINDNWVLYFYAIISLFIWKSVNELHAGNRRMLRVKAKEDSKLYRFLSKRRNPLMLLFGLITSLLLSGIILIMVKGLTQKHGNITVILMLFIVSILASSIASRLNPRYQKIIDDNIDEDIATPSIELITTYYSVLIINILLALFFSAYDTYEFKVTDIDLINFSERVVEVSLAKGDYNYYSRLLINFYLLVDYVKMALAKHLVSIFDFIDNFYGLYVVFVVLNVFKLFGFSIAFVLLHKAFYKLAQGAKLLLVFKKEN